MARRNLDDAMDQYKSDSGEYFKLENDRDTSVVRFLHEGEDFEFDEDWFIVHEIKIDGKNRFVRCSEASNCPACMRLGRKPFIKLYLQLVEKNDSDKRKVWERGQKMIPQLREMIKENGDLCNRPYEIERNGAANDTKTTYSLYPLDRDDKRLRDIPVEPQKILDGKNGLVLDLTDEEMEDALDGRLRLGGGDDRGSSRDRDRGSDRGRGGRDSGGRDSRRGDGRDSRRDSRSDDRSERDSRPTPDDRDVPPARRKKSDTDIF